METREPVKVEVEMGATRASVALVETAPGCGDWSVVGVEVTTDDGAALSADRLRNFAWASLFEQARQQVQRSGEQPRLALPTDPPAAFRVSRRGKAPRTEEDYADLAAAYLAFPADRRHKAASEWSARFGRTAQRWRMDIKRARDSYLEDYDAGARKRNGQPVYDLRLTDEGMRLVYGEGISEQLEAEQNVGAYENRIDILTGGGSEAERAALALKLGRKARAAGKTVGEVRRRTLERDEAVVAEFYSGEQSE